VRVGIGRPAPGRDPADYVLSGFSRAEQKELSAVLDEAVAAIETVVRQGLTPAMNKFNVRNVKKRENTGTS